MVHLISLNKYIIKSTQDIVCSHIRSGHSSVLLHRTAYTSHMCTCKTSQGCQRYLLTFVSLSRGIPRLMVRGSKLS